MTLQGTTSQDNDLLSDFLGSNAHHGLETDDDGNAVLAGQYKIEQLLRRDMHATVYSVSLTTISQTTSSTDEFEARVYVIEGISDELRKYRLRSIKRLKSRTVFESRMSGRIVVVYRVDTKIEVTSPKNDIPLEKENETEAQSEGEQQSKTTQKSDLQREKDRLRQSERRKNRRKEQKLRSESANSENEGQHRVQEPTDDEETFYFVLHSVYNHRRDHPENLPPLLHLQLGKYLQKPPLQFDDISEMETFTAFKLRETAFLNLQKKKLPDVEKRRKGEYTDLLRQLSSLPKGSETYLSLQQQTKIALEKLKAIRHAQEVLPELIAEAEKIYEDMKRALKIARELREEKEGLQKLSNEWHRLKRKVDFCKKMAKEVVPSSEPYAHAVSQVQAAEKELREFEASNGGMTIEMLDSSMEEVQTLLVDLMRDLDVTSTM